MTAPKRVLLMVSSMRGGGSERQVLLLAQHLDRSQFQPHLYLTDAVGDFLDAVPDDVPIHSFDQCPDSKGVYFPGRELNRQTKFVRQVIQDQSIDVIYDRTFHMTLLAGRAAKGIRRVSTIVSPPHLALPLVETRFVGWKRRRLSAAYRSSDVVIAVSDQAAQSARAYYGLPSEQVVVVRNPVDAIAVHHAASSMPETRDQESSDTKHNVGETRLVVVGRMTEEKGHVDLIEALPNVMADWPASRAKPSVRLVGDGPLRESLQTRVQTLGLTEHVRFLGAMPNAAAEIASADALVLPSRFEGMPNVVLEAMTLGTAVVATRAGGTVELQHDQPTAFWADPGNPPSMTEAILSFANNPDQVNRQVHNAKHLVENNHDLKSVVRRIEGLLIR